MPVPVHLTANVSRHFVSFPITDLRQIKLQMLNWANRFNICCLLDNQQYNLPHHQYECLLAAGASHILSAAAGNAFDQLKRFYDTRHDWLFGHFGYDLKNELEPLHSGLPDYINFPDLFFFVPEIIVQLTATEILIGAKADHASIYQEICGMPLPETTASNQCLTIRHRMTKQEYIEVVALLRQHILRGDCYEINFCQELYAANSVIDPVYTWQALAAAAPNPFAAFYKLNDKFLLCASPERYLKKAGNQLYSQPMKGTWQRSTSSESEDTRYKELLYNSAKDRSENVMVVDLVRNDLSKVCVEGSVQVDELFGIYSFPNVHQMVSTVSGAIRPGLHLVDAIRATFPMGSMTGAPKKRVMELIEQYEKTRRGIYSGAVGYITPDGDFDFNVVIRSIMYNASRQYLSYLAGSGITWYSDPEMEYEECLLKAAAMKKVVSGK